MLNLLKSFVAPEATPEPPVPAAKAAKPGKTDAELAADVEREVSAIVAAQADLAQQRQGFRDGYISYRLELYLAECTPAELRPAVRTALKRRLALIERV